MRYGYAAYVRTFARLVAMNAQGMRWIIVKDVQKHAIAVQRNAGAWREQWLEVIKTVAGCSHCLDINWFGINSNSLLLYME